MASSVRAAGFALLLALPRPAAAQAGAAVPPALAAEVAAQVGARWGVPAGQVSLQWGAAPAGLGFEPGTPIRLTGAGLNGWFAVVLRPTEPAATAVRVRAGVVGPVPVAAHALAAGTTLAPGDVRSESRIQWGAPLAEAGYADAGWEVRRPIAPGQPLVAPAVAPPELIAAGQPITVRWKRGDVEVLLTGTALHAARAGEMARVTVDGRPGRLQGRVTGPGTITVEGSGT
jgi:flagella basal body P-ring formation protein FlgA